MLKNKIKQSKLLLLLLLFWSNQFNVQADQLHDNLFAKEYIINSKKAAKLILGVNKSNRISFDQEVREIIGNIDDLQIILDEKKNHIFILPKKINQEINLTILLNTQLQDLKIQVKKSNLSYNYIFRSKTKEEKVVKNNYKKTSMNMHKNYFRIKKYIKNPYLYEIPTKYIILQELNKIYGQNIELIWTAKLKLEPQDRTLVYIYYKKNKFIKKR